MSSVSFTSLLQNATRAHPMTNTAPPRFGNSFKGVMFDTDAARGRTAGESHYLAYCAESGVEISSDDTRTNSCHFRIGSSKSKGVSANRFPVEDL